MMMVTLSRHKKEGQTKRESNKERRDKQHQELEDLLECRSYLIINSSNVPLPTVITVHRPNTHIQEKN
jgi:hypothetical protein